MMTVKDPDGSPTIVYNRDGKTIASITAAGTDQTGATAIIRHSEWTIVLVSLSANAGVRLPSDAEVGDMVTVRVADPNGTGAYSCSVYPDSGSTILYQGLAVNAPVVNTWGFSLMKIAANSWMRLFF